MSIIIKGLNMPKGEFLLEVITHYEGGEKKDIKFVHKEDIIEIPTPHGRLIDGDKLRAKYRRMADLEENQKVSPISWAFAFEDTIDVIDDFPTILEAEE